MLIAQILKPRGVGLPLIRVVIIDWPLKLMTPLSIVIAKGSWSSRLLVFLISSETFVTFAKACGRSGFLSSGSQKVKWRYRLKKRFLLINSGIVCFRRRFPFFQ